MNAPGDIDIRLAGLDDIIGLREAVLIRPTAFTSPYFDGDTEDGTIHIAAYRGPLVIACATLLPHVFGGEPAWQLRGMAVEPRRQRQGIGTRLLTFADMCVENERGGRLLWCNAQLRSVPFYIRNGWDTVDGEFDIPGAGLHQRMLKRR
jgi:hypothetical protein